jgi:DNA-binding CsgD family transcriptional regulator/tetratricopeptide (TPR) repeat protein
MAPTYDVDVPVPGFVGRTRELAALRAEFELVRHGNGRVLLVTADPGVGKTRLMREFAERVRTRSLVLAGRGSPLTGSVPLGIVAEPLTAYLAGLPGELAAGLPPVDLTGGSTGDRPVSLLHTFTALRRLLAALAADRPLVLLLDDMHQGDRSSWQLVAHLGRNPLPAPVLVVAATRVSPLAENPDLAETLGALSKDGIAAEVRLRAFESAEIAELAAGVLGPARSDPELVSWLHSRAGGNPLFTTALLEQLAEDPTRRDVPASVRERVAQIRAALPEPARHVLDLAAVLGHSFPPATIAALCPGTSGLLERLVSERLLVDLADGYDFAHPLLQEAVYETLGAARRRELHEHVGRSLVSAPLAVRAYHIGLGALPGDLAAIEVLRRAARDAERLQSHREVLRHLTTALSLAPLSEADLRRQLLDEIAGQAAAVADHLVGIPALTELIALAAEPVERARAQMRLASFLSTGAADVAAAERAATEAIRLFHQAGTRHDLAAGLNERAWILGMAGDFTAQLAGCREALRVAEDGPAGDSPVVLHIVGPMGAVLGMLGDFAEAGRVHERAVALAAATDDPRQIGWNAAVAHLTELYQGRFSAAAAIVDPVVDPAPLDADIATPWRTLTDWFLGRWQLARQDCATVRDMFPVSPSAHMAWTFSLAALLEVATGESASEPRLAEALAGQATRAYGDRDLYFFTALHHWALGTLNWLTGDPAVAAGHLRRSQGWLETTGAIGFEGLLLAELPEVLVTLGEIPHAQRYADRAAEIGRRLGTDFAAAQAAYAGGVAAQARGDKPAAAAAFTAAVDGYARAGTPFLLARAYEHRAELVPAHRLDDLAAAGRLYSALPAPRHRDRVLARLRADSPAGRRTAQQVGALTTRERQIAVLASRGLASPDIAARLHLSTRTVETHLGRVYHKLRIDGRRGLAKALGTEAG